MGREHARQLLNKKQCVHVKIQVVQLDRKMQVW